MFFYLESLQFFALIGCIWWLGKVLADGSQGLAIYLEFLTGFFEKNSDFRIR